MKIGFIDYYLDEWHANNYPDRLRELSGGRIEVAYAYAEIDSPLGGMTTDEWCAKHNIQRVNSIEELVALSDGIVVLSPDNCERHEDLCRIPLASGKRCYVDKTFAPDQAAARRIFANAEAHNTPCFSSSALRYSAEYQNIDKSSIRAISSWGPAFGPKPGFETYAIHQIEPIMMLMDAQPEKVMMQLCDENFYVLSIRFADGRLATMTGYTAGSPFMLNIAADKNQVIEVKSDYFDAFLRDLVRFFETGEAKVDHETTIRIMAVREAGLKALAQLNEWINV